MYTTIQRNLFLPTCCNPCLIVPISTSVAKPANLSTCLGCKLILYCSTAHQKLDWPIHKKFCKAVGILLAKYKVDHLFAIAGAINTKKELSDVTVKIKCKLVALLSRNLDYHEEELTSFPVMCSVCFSTKIKKLYQCKECNAVSYCCLEHEQEYAPIHQKECHQLKLHYCKFKINSNSVFKLELRKRCKLLESNLEEVMSSMFLIAFDSDPSKSLAEYQKFSFVSDFSCVGTVSYFVQHLKSYQGLVELTIFIAGSTADEVWFAPVHVEFFFSCFPGILKLNIIFIGPEIPESAIMESNIPMNNGRSLFRTSFKGTLESYLQNKQYKLAPDLVVCFNCGFSENAQKEGPSDAWYEGIKHLVKLPDIPVLFTSYTSLEAEFDLKALVQVIEDKKENLIRLEQVLEKKQNPYRDMRPLRYWQFNDPERIFYRNGYVQAVRVINESRKF